MESSIVAPGSGSGPVCPGIWARTRLKSHSPQPGAREVPRDAQGIRNGRVVDRRRIETPNGCQERDSLGVDATSVDLDEMAPSVGLAVVIAAEAELAFRPGLVALVPQGLAGPGVAAQRAAALETRPGMVPDGPVHAEELHLTQDTTEPLQEAETGVDVVTRIREQRTDDQDPGSDRRREEEVLIAGSGHPVGPGAGNGIVQAQCGLNGVRMGAPDGHPTIGTVEDRRLEQPAGAGLAPTLPDCCARRWRPTWLQVTPDSENQGRPDEKHRPQQEQQGQYDRRLILRCSRATAAEYCKNVSHLRRVHALANVLDPTPSSIENCPGYAIAAV